MDTMRHWHEHFWGYGHGWGPETPLMMLGSLFWIALFIGLAGILIYWLMPRILPEEWYHRDIPPDQSPALEILRQRYARGEIDAMTFEHMWERLEASYWQDYQRHAEMLMQDQFMRRRE